MKQKILNNTYLSLLFAEIAMLLDAGITVTDSIYILLEDEPTKDGKEILQTLIDKMESGELFSQAMQNTGSFPRYSVYMIEIGERTGRTVQTLKALSEYYDRQDRLSVTIRNAVLYPLILLVLMIVVVLVLIVEVLPIFNNVFNQLGVQMSPLATSLMNYGSRFGDATIIIAVVFGIKIILLFLAALIPGVRNVIGRWFSNLFGDRWIFGKIASSRFVFAMTLAMASGLDTDESIEIAANISGGSKPVDIKHEKCAELLSSGSTLSDALTGAKILSIQDGKLLSVGSRSGKADEAMAEIARRSDITVQDDIDRIVAGIEPTLVILSSVIVGIILLSVMLPLMSIMTSIG